MTHTIPGRKPLVTYFRTALNIEPFILLPPQALRRKIARALVNEYITQKLRLRPHCDLSHEGRLRERDYAIYWRAKISRQPRCFCEGGGAALLVARYTIRDLKLYLRNISFTSLLLSSCLGCIQLLIGLPFLRGLLMSLFFLPYAYHVVAICLFLLFVFLFLAVFLFVFCVSSVSLSGDDVLCWLLFCRFPSVCFPCSFSERVLGLTWFGCVYLVTMAGFVADQSM